jgi:hypothetical protein
MKIITLLMVLFLISSSLTRVGMGIVKAHRERNKVTTGADNVLYGYGAGEVTTTGSNNICVGYRPKPKTRGAR